MIIITDLIAARLILKIAKIMGRGNNPCRQPEHQVVLKKRAHPPLRLF